MSRFFRISGLSVGHLIFVFGTAGVALGSTGAARAATMPFLPHQALYDLSLVKSRGSAAMDNARGRILYKFSGNACEGYTSDFRQVSEMDNGEGNATLSDLQSTSWEDADGKSFRFKVTTRMNEGDPSEVDGVAQRTDGKIVVKLKKPQPKTFTLDGDTVFPTELIQRIIAAAKDGKSLLERKVYDGSDNGEKVYNTLAVIGQPLIGEKPGTAPDPSITSDQTKALTRWPVTVSYYDRDAKANSGEQTPVYTMSFELYEDGVSRALVLDYNDFVIAGTLAKFDAKGSADAKPCK